jgi:hypothetical protein
MQLNICQKHAYACPWCSWKTCLDSHGQRDRLHGLFSHFLLGYDTAISVAVNTIGLGNPADWVAHLLLGTIIESPTATDYVALAQEAAEAQANRECNNRRPLDVARSVERTLGHWNRMWATM